MLEKSQRQTTWKALPVSGVVQNVSPENAIRERAALRAPARPEYPRDSGLNEKELRGQFPVKSLPDQKVKRGVVDKKSSACFDGYLLKGECQCSFVDVS